MKPLRLEIQGFTVFREKTSVNFEGRSLFAITGSIGAGKSSLLDAMMWALYGNVPRVGAATQQLTSHGLKSMYVLFEFIVRGDIYRVVRRTPSTNSTRLEKQASDGSWDLVADRSRDVTTNVSELLAMDFQTFTRTVILPQGQFDAFLKSDTKARRDILVKLLGLSMYEKARSIANKRADQAQDRARTIETQLEQLELASPDDIKKIKDELNETIQIAEELKLRRQTLSDLGETFRDTREKENILNRAVVNCSDAEKIFSETQSNLEMTLKSLSEFEDFLQSTMQKRIQHQYSPDKHNDLKVQLETIEKRQFLEIQLNEKRQQLQSLNEKQQDLKKNIAMSEDYLKKNQSSIEFKRKDLQQKNNLVVSIDFDSPTEEISQQLQKVQRDIQEQKKHLTDYVIEEKQLSEEVTNQKQNVKSAQYDHDRLLSEQKDLEEKRIEKQTEYAQKQKENVIAGLLSEIEDGDLCPVCGQEMSIVQDNLEKESLHNLHEGLEEINTKTESLQKQFSQSIGVLSVAENQLETATLNLQMVQSKLDATKERLGAFGTNVNQIDEMLTFLEELTVNIGEISNLEKESRNHEIELEKFNLQLSAETGFSVIEEQINDLLQQMDAIVSKPIKISESELKKAIDEYAQLFTEYEKLTSDIAAYELKINENKIKADTLNNEVKRHEKIVQSAGNVALKAEQEFNVLNEDLKQQWIVAIEHEEPDFEKLRRIMESHQHEENEKNALVGSFEAQLQQAQSQRESAIRMHQEVTDNKVKGNLHKTLATELQSSKFIEFVQQEAMNSLASDTSSWLDRFTNGRYELTVESGDFSVVDRLNGDEKRSVKTLSGGESFLTSLALALSLSEHLPELSGLGGGMSLESLFLDEGFGTLDVESLDLAVQGLETLAGGSRLVGVISHVGELGERIPDRIEVIKNGNLSYISE